jgi:HEAT repeat protein
LLIGPLREIDDPPASLTKFRNQSGGGASQNGTMTNSDSIITLLRSFAIRNDPHRVRDAVDALAAFPDHSIAAVIKALADEDDELRLLAVGAAVPDLKGLVGSEISSLRGFAAEAIWNITGDPQDAIDVSVDLLDSDDWLDRYLGAKQLGEIGPRAFSALFELRRLLDDESEDVRGTATAALAAIEA